MAKGGKRAGAGRKKGSLSAKTRAVAEKAAEDGITPLEVMIAAMRAHYEAAARKRGQGKLDTLKIAAEIAKDAAPFMHPRLSAIEHAGKGGGAINILIDSSAKDV